MARPGHIKHECQISWSTISKTAWTVGLLCGNVQDHGLASYIHVFGVYSILGVKFELVLILRSQFPIICANI